MMRICIAYMEWLVQLSEKIVNLKSGIEHSLEGEKTPTPATPTEEALPNGPVEPRSFRWKNADYPLSKKRYRLVKFLWDHREFTRDGQNVRQATIFEIEDFVWEGKEPGDRALPSLISGSSRIIVAQAFEAGFSLTF